MNKILVIGGTTYDTLHLKDSTVKTVGGAGMYTAMAAHRCGAQVSIFSPRPEPSPEFLRPVAERLAEWLGPVITPDQEPRFEISYRQGKTEYLDAFFGAELDLTPALLPDDLSLYDLVHVIPVGNAHNQLALIEACRQRGVQRISAGTWPRDAAQQPRVVAAVIDAADYFFMNGREANAVFGSIEMASTRPGKVLFVTLGRKGARIIQGAHATEIPAVPADELDPTGAGDTFCGATIALLNQQIQPIMAASQAAALCAEMITQVGPTALFSPAPPPKVPVNGRVRVNHAQVNKMGGTIANLEQVSPFPFTGPEYPSVGHAQTVAYFFAATLQQFGFWSEREQRYERPLIATIDGSELKGSDYLWAAYKRQMEREPDFCSPERQALLTRREILQLFRADNGENPMPALDLHLEMANSYGRDMLALDLTPQKVLDLALAAAEPLQAFLRLLDQVGGYKEDPLRKKSSLLAMILNQRPERFLPLRDDEEFAPVVDYHALRSSLRMGLVDVQDKELEARLVNRERVSTAEEWSVRYPTYLAMEQLINVSGKGSGAVDQFLFQARRRCPEMSEPQCSLCPVETVCAQRTDLFQPILRTSFY